MKKIFLKFLKTVGIICLGVINLFICLFWLLAVPSVIDQYKEKKQVLNYLENEKIEFERIIDLAKRDFQGPQDNSLYCIGEELDESYRVKSTLDWETCVNCHLDELYAIRFILMKGDREYYALYYYVVDSKIKYLRHLEGNWYYENLMGFD